MDGQGADGQAGNDAAPPAGFGQSLPISAAWLAQQALGTWQAAFGWQEQLAVSLNFADQPADDELRAGWLGTATTTGKAAKAPAAALPGDFAPALTLTGQNVPAKQKTLGTAKIAGSAGGAWNVAGDAGAVAVGGDLNGWDLTVTRRQAAGQPLPAGLASLTLGDVTSASVTVPDALGPVKALRWADGAIQAGTLKSLAVAGRKASGPATAVVGDFGADVNLLGPTAPSRTPMAGAVTVAHDLAGSVWKVAGSMATLAVTHTALDSTVRASGSIAGVTLGSSDGSQFLAGVNADLPDGLDPLAVHATDLDSTASLGSLTIKGWAVAKDQRAPDFLAHSTFLAPSMGTVSLLNGPLGTWELLAQTDGTNLKIKRVSLKDTRDPSTNWTWPSGKGSTLPVGTTTPIT
jgi:hypothetical protein